MKIKNLLANVVAILTVITLIGGFQINAAEQVTNQEQVITVVETVMGVDEAYAGPCSRRGCDGRLSDCDGTNYTVFALGNLEFTRYCTGTKLNSETEDQIESENPALPETSLN